MRKIFTSVLLFTAFISFSYSQDKMVIAVSPFENLSGNKSENYIGFQISEYMTSALASIDNVTVVERGLLEKVLNEQNLQLSGMTKSKNAVKIGNLVNARQMLIGTYTINRNTINIKGRIVDVESAEITASANISGSYTGNINPVMSDFFYALLDKNPPEEVFSQMSVLEQRISKLESEKNESFATEIKALQDQLTKLENKGVNLKDTISSLKISLAVEAQLSMLKDMDQGASIDAAKALEASFASNDKKALKYLQSAIADPTKSYLSYSLSADSYYEKLSAVEGESFFVKMVKNQLEVNKVLSKDAEAISKYRNTLKLLVNRLYSVLNPDMFTLNVGKDEQIEMGTVSAIITLPSNISINVNEGTQKLLNRVLETQNIIGNSASSKELVFKTAPPVLNNLLPNNGIKELFPMGLDAGIGYSIQFIDKNENVLFELLHENVNSFNLATDESTVWGRGSDSSYSVKEAKDGWSFRDGKVEVQARELRNLHGVKVVLDRRSFTMDYSFPMYSDTKWKSVLLHAYRQKYIKIALGDVEDPMAQVKDIVVTHSVFSVGNYLDGIPLIVDPDYVAGIADLTAVVYWGDSSNTVVTGEWSGVKNYSSENINGNLDSNSVLYFSMPAVMQNGGKESFTVANNRQKEVVYFNSVLGNSWTNDDHYINDFRTSGDWVYTINSADYSSNSGLACLNIYTGETIWINNDYDGIKLQIANNMVYIAGARSGITCFQVNTGYKLWYTPTDRRVSSLEVIGNRIISGGHDLVCLDATTGKLLWKNKNNGSSLQISGNRIYASDSGSVVCLEPETGKTLWKIRVSNYITDLIVLDNKIFTLGRDNVFCIDSDIGEILWEKGRGLSGSDLDVQDDRLYIISDDHTVCLEVETGKILWKTDETFGNIIQVINGDICTVYYGRSNKSCHFDNNITFLEASSGKIIWKNTGTCSNKLQTNNGSILYTYPNSPHISGVAKYNISSLDISVITPWYSYSQKGDFFYYAN